MPPPDEGVSLGELSRRLTDVFTRFEGLARRLEEGQFVRTDLYQAEKRSVDASIADLVRKIEDLDKSKVSASDLANTESRLAQLEDDKKWLIRIVLGLVIAAVVGAVLASGGGF